MIGEYDAIVVLGGNLTQTGQLAERNFPRLNTGVGLWHFGLAPYLVFAGGAQINARADFDPEADQLKDEAMKLKVPQEAILTESNSRDTIGNAVNVANQILVPGNMRRVLLVTSKSHAPRAQRAFEKTLGESFIVDVVAAPERFAAWKRAKAWGAFLTMRYVLKDVQPGDRDAIQQKLREDVPGYGDATMRGLRLKSFFSLFIPPLPH